MTASELYDRAVLLKRLAEIDFDGHASVYLLVDKTAPGVHESVTAASLVEGVGFENDHPLKSFYRGELMPGRQVSAVTSEFCRAVDLDPVDVGDNLVTTGIDLSVLLAGDKLRVGPDVVLERTVVQHKPCVLFIERAGRAAYDVARENNWRGALFDVIRGGRIKVGDPIVRVDGTPSHDRLLERL